MKSTGTTLPLPFSYEAYTVCITSTCLDVCGCNLFTCNLLHFL